MTRAKKFINLLFYLTAFAVVGVGITGFVGMKLGYLSPIRPYVVMSGSMEPAIQTGSVVVVQPSPYGYRPGEVITFATKGDEAVTHRVNQLVAENGQVTYETKGDANKTADGQTVSAENVVGKVILTVPYLGYGVQKAKEPYGFILLVIVPATIIVYEELRNIGKESKRLLRRRKTELGAESLKQPAATPVAVSAAPIISEPILVPTPIPNAPLPPLSFYQRYFPVTQFEFNQQPVEVEAAEPKMVTRPKRTLFGWRWSLAVPTISVLLLFVGMSSSYFSDLETSLGNILQAAATYSQTGGEEDGDLTATTLVINEVMADSSCTVGQGQNQKQAQWIEVYNGYEESVNLKNFEITDGTTTVALVNAGNIIIAPGEMALLAHDNSVWQQCYSNNGTITANLGTGNLNLNTGTLQLIDAVDTVIDTVVWGVSPLILPQDQSVERLPTGWDSALGTNFTAADFMVMDPPSPGL